MNAKQSLKLLVTIVDRGKGENIISFLRERHIYSNLVLMGKGTAPTYWSDLLGMGDKKEVVLSVVDGGKADLVLDEIGLHFDMVHPGHGIAFFVDINSVGSKKILNYFTDFLEEK